MRTISDVKLASLHYLLGGFIATYGLGLLEAMIITQLQLDYAQHSLITFILSIISPILAAWIGVWYSSRLLKTRYVAHNPAKVAFISSLLVVCVSAVLALVVGGFALSISVPLEHNPVRLIASGIAGLVGLILFYRLTLKAFTHRTG